MPWKGVVGFALSFLLLLSACTGERPTDLGPRMGRLKECPESPNCVSSQAADDGHLIPPYRLEGDPDGALARLRAILGKRPDTLIVSQGSDYIRVEFRTTMGFVDDGEFLLDRQHKVIHLRSAARKGYWDLGKNRSRLEEIRRQFEGAGN